MSNASTSACVCVCQCACPSHSVLTAVGELHSLTDWQVSEASEEAELVDFWRSGKARKEETDRRKPKRRGEKSWRSVDEFQAGGIFISEGTHTASNEKKRIKKKLPIRSLILTETLHQLA